MEWWLTLSNSRAKEGDSDLLECLGGVFRSSDSARMLEKYLIESRRT